MKKKNRPPGQLSAKEQQAKAPTRRQAIFLCDFFHVSENLGAAAGELPGQRSGPV